MVQLVPGEGREDLAHFLKRLDPPLELTVSPVLREAVPLWQRQIFADWRGHFEFYTMSIGERKIEGYCFRGIAADETDAYSLIASLLTSASTGDTEDIVALSNKLLQTLFTEEQINSLYGTRY